MEWSRHPRREDTWILEGATGSELHEQLDAVWAIIKPHRDVFRACIAEADHAAVGLSWISDDSGGILTVPPSSLTMLRELNSALKNSFGALLMSRSRSTVAWTTTWMTTRDGLNGTRAEKSCDSSARVFNFSA